MARRHRSHSRHYGNSKTVMPWIVGIGAIAAIGGVIWYTELQQQPLVMPTMDLRNV